MYHTVKTNSCLLRDMYSQPNGASPLLHYWDSCSQSSDNRANAFLLPHSGAKMQLAAKLALSHLWWLLRYVLGPCPVLESLFYLKLPFLH